MKKMITTMGKALAPALMAMLALGGVEETYAQKVTVDLPAAPEGREHIALSSLDLTKTTCGWNGHSAQANKSIDGNAITINDTVYTSGVGTHGPSKIIVKINGTTTDFYATLGIDDEINSTSHGEFDYNVYTRDEKGNTQTVAQGTISCKEGGKRSVKIHADVNGWKYLFLETTNGPENNWNDHVDWANAYFVFQEQNSNPPAIVSEEETVSKLACAKTVFSQPGVRFMQKVRSSNPDAEITVTDLPDGLKWNAERKIVDGIVSKKGVYTYTVNITADGETSSEPVKLTVSDSLQMPTPFMGWISWNSVQGDISETVVRQAVDYFKSSGLYNAGWSNILMDDLWHASSRAADGSPRPNASRFPNGIEPVSKYVHDNGMTFGIYTNASERTCAGAYGSFGHETIDARTYAKWGVDIVKDDYCSAPTDVESCKARYKAQADAFKAAGYGTRLYVCEWGVREPWRWGAEVGGVCWRCTQDVRDCWTGSGTGEGVVQSIRDLKNLSAWAGVNRFNDADMLCTGLHGTGKSSNDLCGSGPGMTQDEYRTQFALWCMWSSPMNLTFDPRKGTVTADDIKILTNAEMIALNQDKMGQQADLVSENNGLVVFAKDCENGDIAVSVTNMSESTKSITLDLSKVGGLYADSTYTCRDVQNQADMPDVKGSMTTSVRTHATNVFRFAKKNAATGIGKVAATKSKVSIKANGKQINVTDESSAKNSKRIVVCDLSGRVVAAITTANPSTDISLPSGIYMVTVNCNAKTTAAKVAI